MTIRKYIKAMGILAIRRNMEFLDVIFADISVKYSISSNRKIITFKMMAAIT
ncbi:hypothetical protein [Chryseobacterium sp. Marseille-Q3244]|uniref:hypothetical protein n=1 Tax=Chryseobacterium sp. Marseille-Q3244 TaxID=2758092 RepID=UPI0020253F76|nr:hypothetical protein [Chryseobacterium sp. Marseille-Q3244]